MTEPAKPPTPDQFRALDANEEVEADEPSAVEALKNDLKEMIDRAAALGSSPTPDVIWSFVTNEFLPYMESLTQEVGEMDEALQEVVEEMPEALHGESAAVFAGVITSGRVLINELAKRAGNDARLLAAIQEWRKLATKGEALLEEITIVVESPDADQEPT